VFKRIAGAALVFSLAACTAPHPRPAPQFPVPQAAPIRALPAPGDYQIDTAQSELRLLVYRAGPLAHLGHNHVMVNRNVSGGVQIADGISASSFFISAPASGFIVDDPQARAEEGGDFAGDVPEDAKAGTRRNMLGAAVLNAAANPQVTVKSVALTGSLDALSADLEINAAGHTSKISAPFVLQGDAHQLTASGSIELRQTALGITPYSLFGGALQVQDSMQLNFKIIVSTN
jgi:hypothetical protein